MDTHIRGALQPFFFPDGNSKSVFLIKAINKTNSQMPKVGAFSSRPRRGASNFVPKIGPPPRLNWGIKAKNVWKSCVLTM